jgi:hypothetical protein
VSIDRSSPPSQIPNIEGGSPRFGTGGEIFFRATGGHSHEHTPKFLYRARPDGTSAQKVLEQPIAITGEVSPDGRWISAWALLPGNGTIALQAFPLDGRPPVKVINTDFGWLPGAIWFGTLDGKSTYVVPLAPGQTLPQIPAGGFHSDDEIARLPGARRIDAQPLAPGPSPDVYAFYRGSAQRNLYRIPIL